MAIDLKFKQDSNGDWDIDFANGDFELTSGLDTAAYMSVLCEKRASSQVLEPNLRRGHFTNEFSKIQGYEVGSLFWFYTQQARNTESNLRLIEGAIDNGLAWMIEDKIFSKIEVSATKSNNKVEIKLDLISKLQKNSQYYNLLALT